MTLEELKEGEKAVILKIRGRGSFRHRIIELGFVRGQMVEVVRWAPLKDPVTFKILDSEISLRRSEAAQIDILVCNEEEASQFAALQPAGRAVDCVCHRDHQDTPLEKAIDSHSVIEVAMIGNPNTGKTSLYNALSGAFEHVGNYSGVTVNAKTIEFEYKGHRIRLTDLPGTYSFSPYSPEERVVLEWLLTHRPDVIINVVDASNLERNLYMTTQLIDMDFRAVVALNMFDELTASGTSLDYEQLGKLLGMPVVPTIGRDKKGTEDLLDTVIGVNEDRNATVRHTHISYAEEVENALHGLQEEIWKNATYNHIDSSRYLALCFLTGNTEWIKQGRVLEATENLEKQAAEAHLRIEKQLSEDLDQVLADYRYAFVKGALKECLSEKTRHKANSRDEKIDAVLTHKIWGFPIFLAIMWVMFQCTFTMGDPIADGMQWCVDRFADWLNGLMPDNVLRACLVDGVVQGVGGVLVFLPNILILFLFISLMEATGYMARVAFIMDKIMHSIGLHGKSFIPLLIGFGCNVPAIMATRTIENKKDRIMTMLIVPFMSCSARLPVYILLVGMFFGARSGTVIFLIYLFGIIVSILSALLFRHTILKGIDSPFVMEMPPYRKPSLYSLGRGIWNRTMQYLKKIGGVILIASVIVWALGYFPVDRTGLPEDATQEMVIQAQKTHMGNSYLGRIGKFIEPVMKPLGLDWKMSVCLLAGVSAKEVVVSTMNVIMEPETTFTPLSALAFVFFVLLYFPCIGVFSAVAKESGKWKWALFMAVYTTAVAWLVSFAVYRIGLLLL